MHVLIEFNRCQLYLIHRILKQLFNIAINLSSFFIIRIIIIILRFIFIKYLLISLIGFFLLKHVHLSESLARGHHCVIDLIIIDSDRANHLIKIHLLAVFCVSGYIFLINIYLLNLSIMSRFKLSTFHQFCLSLLYGLILLILNV